VLDEPATGEHVEAARAGAFEQLRRVLELVVALGGPDQRAELDAIATDPTRAAFECCRLAPVGALDAQRLLSCADATERFEMLAVLLDDLAAVLSAGLDDR
jgi:Lon protease-like protein